MSIIYDALKKVETSLKKPQEPNINLAPKTDKISQTNPKFKIYFLYILIAGIGIFIAGMFFNPLKKTAQTKIAVNIPSLPKSEPAKNTTAQLIEPAPVQQAAAVSSSLAPEEIIAPAAEEKKEEPKKPLVLNGVFFSEDQGYALINNQIAKTGDTIEGAQVVRITADEVELTREGSSIKLSTRR